MPNGTVCTLVKLPVVVGEQVVNIDVDNVTCLEEQAKRVDHIDVSVRDLEAEPVYTHPTSKHGKGCFSPKATVHFGDPKCDERQIKTIEVSGTIHKQIYYVDRNDNVLHMGEDIDFVESVDLDHPVIVRNKDNVEIDFRNVDIDVSFNLRRPTRIHQVANVSFTLKIIEQMQLYVNIFPDGCEPTATLGIEDVTFEDWTGNLPTGWEGTNVAPYPDGRTGMAAMLGACPTLGADLFRRVEPVVAGATHSLSFWARSLQKGHNPCDYTLTAQIQYLDEMGNTLGTAQQVFTSQQINLNGFQQFTVSGPSPEGTVAANIAFIFAPQSWNTCAVLIDDVSFGQV
ncbi:DUF3794 domain-containing protein [Desulforamulus ferrireducens]|uniref:SipL SPOCS domain-containing protein n=1 Tax=Desulforamulus ferrireducens TaxID=1833852 RepID=A0A1S6IST1_9FIRM|nr:DUF3794 domain-containing protein [Desulforamulus ferrireducens]AQS57830.1 hypothetical protein B0537_01130 [Desulforamulus ferrireducens]